MFEHQPRIVEQELDELLDALPAVSIEGPRAVGKTWTADRHANTTYALDDPDTLAEVRARPGLLTQGEPPILIDEWQRYPASWDIVRRAVDEDFSPGRFILTGSTRPDTRPTHSGAGRIVTLRMWTTSLAERRGRPAPISLKSIIAGERPDVSGRAGLTVEDYATEIVAGGFPGWRGVTGRPRDLLVDGYLHRLVEHDFALLGRRVRNAAALRRWLVAYAAATAGTASYETIRDAATSGEGDKPAKSTTIAYRDTLEAMWVLEPLPAWLPVGSHLSRLKRGPKHHLADTALAARLLKDLVDALVAETTQALHEQGDGCVVERVQVDRGGRRHGIRAGFEYDLAGNPPDRRRARRHDRRLEPLQGGVAGEDHSRARPDMLGLPPPQFASPRPDRSHTPRSPVARVSALWRRLASWKPARSPHSSGSSSGWRSYAT